MGRAKYRGLLKHLALSSGFLSDVVCMKDEDELGNLPLKVQKRDTPLVDASCHIEQTIDVVRVMKERRGKTADRVMRGIAKGQFNEGKINRLQFYQAVIDNLTERLPNSELVALLKPLDKLFWPKQRDSLISLERRK